MEPVRVLMRAGERSGRAGEDRNVRPADVGGEERVAGRLFETDVAGDGRQRQHAHVRRRKRHHDRDRVVGGGVGVDEEVAHRFSRRSEN